MATQQVELIGGNGGTAFDFTGLDNGSTLKKIGVGVAGWQIRVVRVELTDGRTRTFGNGTITSEFEFGHREHFARLSLWGNGEGTRLGGIKFRTNTGREFFAKMTDRDLKTEYNISVGSGVCVGVRGRGGADIDCMGFVFLRL